MLLVHPRDIEFVITKVVLYYYDQCSNATVEVGVEDKDDYRSGLSSVRRIEGGGKNDMKNHRIVYNPDSIIQLDITLSHQIHVVVANFLSSRRSRIFLCIGRRRGE